MSTAFTYTVLAGDSLYSIATNISASAGVTSEQIQSANPDVLPEALQIGQKINIPAVNNSRPDWVYTILAGDTFSHIAAGLARCAGLTYQEIQQFNDLTNTTIQPGQKLRIPSMQDIADDSDSESHDSTSPDNGQTQPVDAEQKGYWDWTWSGHQCPENSTLTVAFSGWTNVSDALSQSAKTLKYLKGTKYLSFGGGNKNGRFSGTALDQITEAIQNGKLKDYDGIAYDIEEGDAGLSNAFARSFQAAKENNLKVLVTVSHSAPYGITDADELMRGFFADDNIDILSPQLYTSGKETANDYVTTAGTTTTWQDYASAKAVTIPSIVSADMYESAKSYFASQQVTLHGYIQWQQVA